MCGEIGFPGEDEADIEVPATIGGMFASCLLEELEDRWFTRDEDIESVSTEFESLIPRNRESCALVLFVDASKLDPSREDLKLLRSFFWSSIFKKSEMLSSSVWREPELVPPSGKTPDPGCAAEDVALALPLLLSSSVLLPPVESFAFRCPKLLLYLAGAGGLVELAGDGGPACSFVLGELRDGTCPDGWRASARTAKGDDLPNEDPARGTEDIICSPWEGDADSDGALNGMKETEGLRPTFGGPSADRRDDLEPCVDLMFGGTFFGILSSGLSDPATLAARRADMGLVPGWRPT